MDKEASMTDIRKLLATNLKKYRKLNGFTQEKLAEEAHAAASYIGMVETGRKFPSAEMLARLAAALHIDTPDLFSTQDIRWLPPERKALSEVYKDVLDDIEALIRGKIEKL
jgi:transcriptional regulator with XRE-family HTH domain